MEVCVYRSHIKQVHVRTCIWGQITANCPLDSVCTEGGLLCAGLSLYHAHLIPITFNTPGNLSYYTHVVFNMSPLPLKYQPLRGPTLFLHHPTTGIVFGWLMEWKSMTCGQNWNNSLVLNIPLHMGPAYGLTVTDQWLSGHNAAMTSASLG